MQQQSTSLCDIKYKIVFLGNMGVGKTSIIERFVKDQFDPFNNPTVGIDFLTRNISYQNKTYRLQLWDTAGQQKYKSLVPAYLRDANCAVFVFDFGRKQTFQDLPNWIQLYRDHASEMSVGFILGNKSDLLEEPSKQAASSKDILIQIEVQAKQLAQKQNMVFKRVSAKTGKEVMSTFQNMIQQLQGGSSKTLSEEQEDPESIFENQVLQKMQKLKLQDVKKGKYASCCYI